MTDFVEYEGRMLHPDMVKLLELRGSFGTPSSPEELAEIFETYCARVGEPHPADMKVEERTLDVGSAKIGSRIYWPAGAGDNAPCILYMHGGGFVMGDPKTSDHIAWGFAADTGCVVVSIDYRLAPQHRFPCAVEDSYGALCLLAERPSEFGIDPTRIITCGDSAGGNLSATVTLAAKQRGGPATLGQVLMYPAVGLKTEGGSYDENTNGPGLTTAQVRNYNKTYMAADDDWNNPLAWPSKANDLSNLPPAYVHTADLDPLRDDGQVYASMLIKAGNDVTYRNGKGMIHGFLRARALGPGGKAEFDAVTAWIRARLA